MDAELRQKLLSSAEKMTELALSEAVEVAELLAKKSESTVDDSVVAAVKMLKSAFLDELVNKIDGQEG